MNAAKNALGTEVTPLDHQFEEIRKAGCGCVSEVRSTYEIPSYTWSVTDRSKCNAVPLLTAYKERVDVLERELRFAQRYIYEKHL